jgi:hypothetical protein
VDDASGCGSSSELPGPLMNFSTSVRPENDTQRLPYGFISIQEHKALQALLPSAWRASILVVVMIPREQEQYIHLATVIIFPAPSGNNL